MEAFDMRADANRCHDERVPSSFVKASWVGLDQVRSGGDADNPQELRGRGNCRVSWIAAM